METKRNTFVVFIATVLCCAVGYNTTFQCPLCFTCGVLSSTLVQLVQFHLKLLSVWLEARIANNKHKSTTNIRQLRCFCFSRFVLFCDIFSVFGSSRAPNSQKEAKGKKATASLTNNIKIKKEQYFSRVYVVYFVSINC